jgi:hypothetical protein
MYVSFSVSRQVASQKFEVSGAGVVRSGARPVPQAALAIRVAISRANVRVFECNAPVVRLTSSSGMEREPVSDGPFQESKMKKNQKDGDDAMQGGGYGGLQGRGGSGRDLGTGDGELQGGSYGRNTGRADGIRRNIDNPADDAERERLARPPIEVDEDGQETTIEDDGRSADRREIAPTDLG